MSFPNKTKLPTAIDKITEFQFNPTHVTTSNFMSFDVGYSMELVPKQKINNFSIKTFARLEPLTVPTFGLAKIHKKAFFVPYRTVFPAFTDFINDVTHTYSDGVTSQVVKVPSIKNSTIVKAFINSRKLTATPNLQDTNGDVVVTSTSGSLTSVLHYRFTSLGRKAFKMLNALGYRINWSLDDNDFEHSLLPLFSLAKVYADWYYPNQYAQDNVFAQVEKWFKYDTSNLNYTSLFDTTAFLNIITFCNKVCYDNDFFTSAWDNPFAPNSDAHSRFNIVDITAGENYKQQISIGNSTAIGNFNAPKLTGGDTLQSMPAVHSISQYALTALKSLTDYMKRHQIAGARTLDRYLSRWGISLPADKLNRSLYIGGDVQEIQFGDVTSTADTDGAILGSYAGKGVSYGEGNFSFEATEFGQFIVITTIVPKTSYYQGAARQTINLTKLDFYTPEFDNLGVQPLLTREVFLPLDSQQAPAPTDGSRDMDSIFGYVPRYAHYKVSRDILGGDYVLGSRNAGKDAWTLFRDLSTQFGNTAFNDIKHNVNFVNGSDSEQYNRIFSYVDSDYDKFNIIHQMDITTTFPGHSLYDDYEFDTEGKSEKVTIDTGSVKAN